MADERVDDETILDDDNLLRRIPDNPSMIKYDRNLNAYRMTSACFADRLSGNKSVSVTLEQSLMESGGCHEDALRDDDEGLASIEVKVVRHELEHRQKVLRDPVPDDPHHGLVEGEKTKSCLRKVAKSSTILRLPVSKRDD